MFFTVLLVDDVGLWFFYARRNYLMAGASEAVPMPLELFDIDHEE